MISARLNVLLLSAALACGACTTVAQTAQQAAIQSTPSPRPDCAQQHVTIYFSDEVQSNEPVAMPLLNTLMDQVHACERAGGELRGITIASTADPGQSARDALAQIQRRDQRVRDALVHLGAQGGKIHFAPAGQADPDAIMAKHADVTADLY
jgi:hypothetical protein